MGQFDRTLAFISDVQSAETAGAVCEKLLGITSEFGLTALMAGLGPRLARRQSRSKAAAAALMTRPLAALTRSGDKVAVKLIG